jgi:hypothetical protein
MDFNRSELAAALQKCLPGVDSGKMLIEGADTFIFEEGKIHSYNDVISVTTSFPHELSGAVKALEFYKLISKSPSETIKIAVLDSEDSVSWKIKMGTAIAELSLLESSVINHVKSLNIDSLKWKKIPSNFTDGLSMCKISNNHISMVGIFVKDNVIVSTDELTINWFVMDGKMSSFWIDNLTVTELTKISGLKEYALSDGWIHFRIEDGTVFSSKRLDESGYLFPNIQQLIEMHCKKEADIPLLNLPQRLTGALERASALAMNTIDSYSTVELTFKKEHIEIRTRRTTGKYSEKIPWDQPIKFGEPVSVFVDCSMLSRILKRALPFFVSEFNDQKNLIFKSEGFIHLMSTFSEEE